ncbi:MAG: NUDIX domain-containing protein [Deltaproteobacteria bacterium]|jgi:ADP-ribose pyrophosphatase YjhB (NUDIX family)|nr:NUDIX domain-containing protein [Deltaproteobacteria bacterium]MBW2695572.1 NUDIX domain-containing protein [Deltaproteobacteria bacterium]
MERVRSAAKAVIVRRGRLLLIRCRDAEGDWYGLPGGGQQVGESLAETLVRECHEEIGAEVEVVRLLYVRDYIAAKHDFSYLEASTHQVEHLFECRVAGDYQAANGSHPDTDQVAVEWLDHEMLRAARVYPSGLRDIVDPERADALPSYWGDVN